MLNFLGKVNQFHGRVEGGKSSLNHGSVIRSLLPPFCGSPNFVLFVGSRSPLFHPKTGLTFCTHRPIIA